MYQMVKLFGLAVLLTLGVAPFASPVAAQTYNETYNFGGSLGTLNYTAQISNGECDSNYGEVSYTLYDFYNFVYVDNNNVSTPLDGEAYWYYGIGGRNATGDCPDPARQNYTYSGSTYSITIAPSNSQTASISMAMSGWLNPKYEIVNVMYAPPGSKSTATYGNNTVLGNSTSVSNSYSNQNGKSVKVAVGGGVFGFSVTETTTTSDSYTQEQDTSSSVAISQTSSSSRGIDGFSDPANGINHDYDQINVWLNPVAPFTLNSTGATPLVQWNGQGYDLNDRNDYPDMDIVNIELGCLNGDFYALYVANPSLNPNWLTCEDIINQNFSRTWALDNVDGSSPALTPTLANSAPPYNFCAQTGTDLYNLCQVDPYANSKYALTFPAGSNTTTDGRFTACSNSGCSATIEYEPNSFNEYSQGYSSTVTSSQDGKYTYTDGYSVETEFKDSGKAGPFSASITETFTNSNTMTWVNQFMQSTNSSNGQTASFTIMGPAEGYTGPTQFVVYQDNLYGTFMFAPGN